MMARRDLLAIAAVTDIALHARGKPVAAKELAARHGLAPRQLETLLRDLVRANILKGTRGPRGGYELARERRRISLGAIVRALDRTGEPPTAHAHASPLLETVVVPAVGDAWMTFLHALDEVSIATLADRAKGEPAVSVAADPGAFVI